MSTFTIGVQGREGCYIAARLIPEIMESMLSSRKRRTKVELKAGTAFFYKDIIIEKRNCQPVWIPLLNKFGVVTPNYSPMAKMEAVRPDRVILEIDGTQAQAESTITVLANGEFLTSHAFTLDDVYMPPRESQGLRVYPRKEWTHE